MRSDLVRVALLVHQNPKLHSLRPLVRRALKRELRKLGAWKTLPKGWTEESLKKFWDSLTGEVKHKVTKCIKKMEDKMDNPGAFCSSIRDRLEGTSWRSERN